MRTVFSPHDLGVYISFACMYVCPSLMPGALNSQKRLSNPLGMELYSCEQPYWSWDSNLDHRQQERLLLTTIPSPWAPPALGASLNIGCAALSSVSTHYVKLAVELTLRSLCGSRGIAGL